MAKQGKHHSQLTFFDRAETSETGGEADEQPVSGKAKDADAEQKKPERCSSAAGSADRSAGASALRRARRVIVNARARGGTPAPHRPRVRRSRRRRARLVPGGRAGARARRARARRDGLRQRGRARARRVPLRVRVRRRGTTRGRATYVGDAANEKTRTRRTRRRRTRKDEKSADVDARVRVRRARRLGERPLPGGVRRASQLARCRARAGQPADPARPRALARQTMRRSSRRRCTVDCVRLRDAVVLARDRGRATNAPRRSRVMATCIFFL